MSDSIFSQLFWEGFHLTHHQIEGPWLHLHLEPNQDARCGLCQRSCPQIHERLTRQVREANLLNYLVILHLSLRRVRCPGCGVRVEHVPWLERHSRLTRNLKQLGEELCRFMTVQDVATSLKLNWHQVKEMDKNRLKREIPTPNLSRVRCLMMDEFALHRGHRYATVVADAQTRQVLWVGLGRSRISLRPFFKFLGEYCHQIEAVAMDMNTAYDLEVKQHCPQAEVVYDLFHVVAKFGREVIDRVRVDQANRLRHDKPARRVIKSSRWLLLKNREKLNPAQELQLQELLEANHQLWVVYLIKDQLKQLWRVKSLKEAFVLWRGLWRMATESGIEPLARFFRNLKPYLRGILAAVKFPLNTSVLEGMNNKIKLIKRKAYGYRDFDYFVLKIKAAFPGNLR